MPKCTGEQRSERKETRKIIKKETRNRKEQIKKMKWQGLKTERMTKNKEKLSIKP